MSNHEFMLDRAREMRDRRRALHAGFVGREQRCPCGCRFKAVGVARYFELLEDHDDIPQETFVNQLAALMAEEPDAWPITTGKAPR